MARKTLRLLTLLLCLTLIPLVSLTEGSQNAEGDDIPIGLSVGSKGQEVVRLKERLKELGYYPSSKFTKSYTKDTAEVVKDFQRVNGLPETGEADAMTLTVLYSDDALAAPRPTLPPLATPAPTPVPEDLPARDPEGFLATEGAYFYENDDEGLWMYLGPNLQVEIVRREDSAIPLEWYETDIRVRGDEALRTVVTDANHLTKHFNYPHVIAEQEGFVLAFTDDFFGNRLQLKEVPGIVVRQKQLLCDLTNRTSGHYLPNLDMMAQYPDGRLEVYHCNEITSEELLERGAVNVFSFGPILIRDGEINELVYSYYRSIEPRHALGMIEPNHYFLLTVTGRNADSKGTFLQRVAEMMLDHGVTQALNLDGGNTAALVFRGKMINKLAVFKKRSFVRTVNSLIGVGKINTEE